LCRERPGFEPAFIERLVRRYGSLTGEVLGDARREADLGQSLGGGLTEREVRYLSEREWAHSAEDVLWRRTKCGLHMNAADRDAASAKIATLL
jgi:glycerol-3-phosphate dehydrogenase